ncbi:hypothetical protein AAVH_18515 [Aphelenchoides avenae]|nr:hypothetical protein AAVH_18515 [Aphelenchus avenae]
MLPREWTMQMLPVNICIRMFCQAILVFKSCYFDAEYDEKLRDMLPSYNRMCPQTPTTDSIKGHCGSETSDDEADEHALEKVWRVTQKSFDQQSRGSTANASAQSESSGLLTSRSDVSHNYKTMQTSSRHLPPAKVRHNCLTSPCTQSNATSNCCDEHHDGFHVYDPEGSESKKAQRLSLISNKITHLDPHDRLPDRLLTSFVILTALAFVAHRILGQTEGHVPLIALIALIVSVSIMIAITFFVWRIRLNEEDSPWKPLSCLASIFLLIHILCETTMLKCAVAFCWTVIGKQEK